MELKEAQKEKGVWESQAVLEYLQEEREIREENHREMQKYIQEETEIEIQEYMQEIEAQKGIEKAKEPQEEIKIPMYSENLHRKIKEAKRKQKTHFDKHNSISYLSRRVQSGNSTAALEKRLKVLESKKFSKKHKNSSWTKSQKIYRALEKNRAQAKQYKQESTDLMYKLLPGKQEEIEQLAPRTFLYKGTICRLKRHFDDFRVYVSKPGETPHTVIRGNKADLESAVNELKMVHHKLIQ